MAHRPPPPASGTGPVSQRYDTKTQSDIDYLADVLARAFNHAVSFGLSDGLRLNGAFETMRKSKAGPVVLAKALAIYCNTNPAAADAIATAAMLSPKLADILQRIGAMAKPADPA